MIKEYGSFCAKQGIPGYQYLPEPVFSQLEEFVLSNQGSEADALELMGLSARKGVGKIITAKNYVGIITMKDGTTIEILPKIYSETDHDESGIRTKKLLIDMLKTLRDVPYKTLQTSTVNIDIFTTGHRERIFSYETFCTFCLSAGSSSYGIPPCFLR